MNHTFQTKFPKQAQIASLAFAGALILASPAFRANAQEEDRLPDSGNYIDLTLGHASHDGNEAAYLARYPIKKHAYGGIERFQYYGYAGDYTELSVEGRAMFDLNDYMLGVKFLNEEVGFFKFKWEEYRVFYDGSGPYFPGSNTFIQLFDDELALDRSKFEIDAGLFLENGTNVEFGYTRLEREGLKSSTESTNATMPDGFGLRYISPTFLDIDETRHIFDLLVDHKFGDTKAAFAIRSENNEGNNKRKITRGPGESSFRRVTHREAYDSDLFSARATTITELGEKNRFTTGIAYTEIDVNASGDRIIAAEFDAPYDMDFQGQRRDHGWLDLVADSQIDQWLVNANLMTFPAEDWKSVYSIRLEEMTTDIDSTFTETEFSTSTNIFEEEDIILNGDRDWNDAAVSAEFIYTGQEDAVYNGSILYSSGDGDQMEEEFDADSGAELLERLSNIERDVLKIALGAKFYPSSSLRYFVQYYHKERDNKFNHIIDPTEPGGGNRFPAFTDGQDFTTDDLNVSVHWKGTSNFSGTTRIDYQKSTIDSRGQGLDWALSYDREALILSQSVTLAFENFFILASGIFSDDKRESPVSSIGGNVADTVIVLDGDFVNGNVSANWGIDDVSNAGISLFYNRVDNLVDNSEFGQPYGEDITEYGISATYTRQLLENAQLTLRYSYYDSEDRAAGGFNDYDAQVLYSSIRYRF